MTGAGRRDARGAGGRRTGRLVAGAALLALVGAAGCGEPAGEEASAGGSGGGRATATAASGPATCDLPPDLAAGLDTLAAEDGADEPVRVILVIGDGVGTGYWSAARLRRPDLAAFGLPVVGFTDSRNALGRVTDSAASGTALATGCLTYNGAIGMGPDTTALTSVAEIARRRGLATGLVTTSRVTHATPAAFVAHVVDRYSEEAIAGQMADAGLDVLLGGGRRYFRSETRADGRDLLSGLREDARYLEDPAALRDVAGAAGKGNAAADGPAGPGGRTGVPDRLVGLFAGKDLPPAPGRDATLASMTRAALAVLDRDPDGFFLVVEAAQPDWRGHDAAPLEAVQAEMLGLDDAVRAARDYRERRPGTLLVVTADHETGGLAVAEDDDGLTDRWATGGSGSVRDHTADLTPHFAAGPGARALRGIQTPASTGRFLLRTVGGSAVEEVSERPAGARADD